MLLCSLNEPFHLERVEVFLARNVALTRQGGFRVSGCTGIFYGITIKGEPSDM
jgi:hypothetical protein